MKKILLLAGLALQSLALADSTSSDYAPEVRSSMETFTSKILKIYAFKEGEIDYVAYVVNWRDHEVVVTPLSGVAPAKKYQVGDSLRCRMSLMTRQRGNAESGMLRFTIEGEEPARLQEIEQEIRLRRERREEQLRQHETPTQP